MAWFDKVSTLTPLAVFDADSLVENGAWKDKTGLPITAALNGQKVGAIYRDSDKKIIKALIGTDQRVQYSTNVKFPLEGLFIAYVKPRGKIVLNTEGSGTSTYLLAYDPSKNKWFLGDRESAEIKEPVWQVVAIKWSNNNFRLYGDNNWQSEEQTFAYKINSLQGIIYDSGYNLKADLAAWGLFSGKVTLADLQSIESDLLTAFILPEPANRFYPIRYGYIEGLPRDVLANSLPYRNVSADVTTKRKNAYLGGAAVIYGNVKIGNAPAVREVKLFEKMTDKFWASTWSDATGYYEFKNIRPDLEYYVIAFDYKRLYNAVIKDALTPAATPVNLQQP